MTNDRPGIAVRKPKAVVVVAGLIVVLTLGFGATVTQYLSAGGFDAKDTESDRVARTVEERFGAGDTDAVLLVRAESGDVDDPAVAEAAEELVDRTRERDGVEEVISYWEVPQAPGLLSDEGDSALVLIELEGTENDKNEWLRDTEETLDDAGEAITVQIGGNSEVFRAIQDQIITDLVVAEGIAVVISMVLLLMVFRSLVAALLPIAVGLVSAGLTLFVLRVLAEQVEVSVFALNLTSALALGLGIDYGLLMVSRFREELGSGRGTVEAVGRTMRTAGRTVVYSGVTVGLSLSTLLLFPLPFLRSFAYAAIPVVFGTVLCGVLLLPALLTLLGPNVEKGSLRRLPSLTMKERTWERMARWSLRRRIPVAAVLTLGLVLLAVPFLHADIGKSDDRVLPEDTPVTMVQQEIREGFPGNTAFPLRILLPGAGEDEGGQDVQREMAERISQLDGVSTVRGAGGLWEDGEMLVQDPSTVEMADAEGSYLETLLDPGLEVYSSEAGAVVEEVRALSHEGTTPEVTGEASRMVDNKDVITERLPWAVGIIALFSAVLIFLMTGSVLVPVKALVLNFLSLTAMFGVMVWGFQDGNLEGLLGFTPTGYLDNAMPILMFCVAFGLSMDYELFLVARMKEEYDRTGDNTAAVVAGITKTGAVITAAAMLMAVVFAGMVFSQVSLIQMAGLGVVLAILVDAFVIRAFLVPALMGLMGHANWWAPPFMRRFHERAGLREGPGGDVSATDQESREREEVLRAAD